LRARADALQREADDARTALRAVLDSRWWRLGEPWRALRRRLRRPPG
jgi:hypothetical protein